MKNGTLIGATLLAASIGFGVQAQNTPPNPNTGANNPMAPDNTMKATAPGTTSFSGWANDYSKAHQGRISRQAYMDEAGRRWDALDKNNQGLTTSEISRMNGWSSTGSGMGGPGADKGGK